MIGSICEIFSPAKYPAVESTTPATQSAVPVISAVFAILFIFTHLLSYKSVYQTSDSCCTPFTDIYGKNSDQDPGACHKKSAACHHTRCCHGLQYQHRTKTGKQDSSGYRCNTCHTGKRSLMRSQQLLQTVLSAH